MTSVSDFDFFRMRRRMALCRSGQKKRFFNRQRVETQLRSVALDNLSIARGIARNDIGLVIENPPFTRRVLIQQIEEPLKV